MPWYHSTDEIREELQALSQSCEGFRLETRSKRSAAGAAGQDVDIDVVRIGSGGGGKKAKAMLVFNEHARELITAESALGLLQALCGQGASAELARRALQTVDFTIVPNANPLGRRQVEAGAWCKRTNEDGVDLNRNWGDQHRNGTHNVPGDEENPGPRGFSEPESHLLRALVQEERPDLFVSVHSGAYLLGTPYGYTQGKVPQGAAAAAELLGPISRSHCGGDCPYGNLAELIHYNSMGCDIDWVVEHVGTPYAYTWEIYSGDAILRQRYVEQAGRRARAAAKQLEDQQGADAVSAPVGPRPAPVPAWRPEAWEDCMGAFLPQSESETQEVVRNWAGAYLEISQEVASRVLAAAAPAAANATNVTAPKAKSGLLA